MNEEAIKQITTQEIPEYEKPGPAKFDLVVHLSQYAMANNRRVTLLRLGKGLRNLNDFRVLVQGAEADCERLLGRIEVIGTRLFEMAGDNGIVLNGLPNGFGFDQEGNVSVNAKALYEYFVEEARTLPENQESSVP